MSLNKSDGSHNCAVIDVVTHCFPASYGHPEKQMRAATAAALAQVLTYELRAWIMKDIKKSFQQGNQRFTLRINNRICSLIQ